MWIEILFLVAIVVYLIWGVSYNVKKRNAKHEERNSIKQKGTQYNARYSTDIKHICGLPLAENSDCIIHLCDTQVVIEGTGEIYKLQLDRILDMSIKTSKEVQNSISGAVGGYILLGPVGAFLGGSTTDFHRFFIIIYKNKENQKVCISFDMKDNSKIWEQISDYIKKYKNNIEEKQEIEL